MKLAVSRARATGAKVGHILMEFVCSIILDLKCLPKRSPQLMELVSMDFRYDFFRHKTSVNNEELQFNQFKCI